MALYAFHETDAWQGEGGEPENFVYLEVVCREYDEQEGLMACDVLKVSDEAAGDGFVLGQVVYIYFDEGTEKWSIWEEKEAWKK
jgi:hypothetical protein